ncbi:MAG: NYN domain-containing protein [Candidatus Omnitrophota bacterium]|nr:NYN domain-containing protein [Candidatus Omnitrophota bacterium]
MKTTLIVDGYNAINAISETRKKLKESLFSARSEIIIITKEYVRSSGYITDFCVVFDGQDRYRYLDRFNARRENEQVFSDSWEGDEKIIDTIREYSKKGKVIIASNDNYVRNNSRAYGASLLDVRHLVKRKTGKTRPGKKKDKKIDKRLREEITREYMEELGL